MLFFDATHAELSVKEKLVIFLNQFQHPALPPEWASSIDKHYGDWVREFKSNEFVVAFPFACASLINEFAVWFEQTSAVYEDIPDLSVDMKVLPMKTADKPAISGVKNLIVVSSAKGGVGKSTTAANLALALHMQGATVGLLDADIYGPSLPLMLGTKDQTPSSLDGKYMEPVMAHHLQTNSIGYLVPDENAMVWRGPMASKAFAQLMQETRWQDVDYLVVDMPPGTGDIQLSLAQQFPVTGAIVVTTPQDLALADAMKGVAMFDKVEVPVLGVVENMSYHICTQCGHQDAIFGEGGGEQISAKYGLSLLAKVPLDRVIQADIDKGSPTVVASPSSEHANIYLQMALNVASQVYFQNETRPQAISVVVSEES